MQKIELQVQNIRCNGCANTISQKLLTLPGVQTVHVDILKEIITVQRTEQIEKNNIVHVLFKLGYPEERENNTLVTKIKSIKSCAIGKIN